MIEAPAAYRTDRNALFFTPCVAQGSERDPFLLPALRRTPKDTLFCSLRCAGLRKRPFFAPCVAQGSERDPVLLPALRRAPKDTFFCSLRCAGLQKTPCFAPCVAQGSERDPFLLPALRRAPKIMAFHFRALRIPPEPAADSSLRFRLWSHCLYLRTNHKKYR